MNCNNMCGNNNFAWLILLLILFGGFGCGGYNNCCMPNNGCGCCGGGYTPTPNCGCGCDHNCC